MEENWKIKEAIGTESDITYALWEIEFTEDGYETFSIGEISLNLPANSTEQEIIDSIKPRVPNIKTIREHSAEAIAMIKAKAEATKIHITEEPT